MAMRLRGMVEAARVVGAAAALEDPRQHSVLAANALAYLVPSGMSRTRARRKWGRGPWKSEEKSEPSWMEGFLGGLVQENETHGEEVRGEEVRRKRKRGATGQ